MKIEIDQSGKVEDTSKDTILAFSNRTKYAIKIPARVKRDLQTYFRQIGEPKLFIYKTFVVGLYLLVNPFITKITTALIDIEYSGQNELLKRMLGRLFTDFGYRYERANFQFQKIGKTSKAHGLAYEVFKGKLGEDKIISFEEMFVLIKKLKPTPT